MERTEGDRSTQYESEEALWGFREGDENEEETGTDDDEREDEKHRNEQGGPETGQDSQFFGVTSRTSLNVSPGQSLAVFGIGFEVRSAFVFGVTPHKKE
jgi:hypothetical protein